MAKIGHAGVINIATLIFVDALIAMLVQLMSISEKVSRACNDIDNYLYDGICNTSDSL